MRNEDLPSAHNLCQRHALICFPVLHCLRRIDKDDEVVALALEVNLGLLVVAAHSDCYTIGSGWSDLVRSFE